MNFERSKLEQKYLNDTVFYTVVQMFYQAIQQHGITPSELREALFLAHYKYEMDNPEAVSNRLIDDLVSMVRK